MQSAVARYRLFFALWPSDEMRAQIEQGTRELVRGAGGRPIPGVNLHVTLSFLGAVPITAIEGIVAAAAHVRAPAFTLEFDRAEIWSRARVLVLTASRTPDALMTLVEGLQISSLQSNAAAQHQEYRAHITLARDVERRAGVELPPAPRLFWTARDFALVVSKPGTNGSVYSVLHRWVLA